MSTLLIIDDSKTVREEIKKTLSMTTFFNTILEANNGVEGFKILINNDIDIVVCDVVMPSIDGFRFLSMMKAKPEYQDTPVIMLTGEQSTEKKIKGLNEGAADYVTKPFDPGELVARIKVQLKLKSLQDELKRISHTDVLTKIHNRRYIMELLESEFDRARRYQNLLSVLMLDIDHFKNINDTYGHQTGDEILSGIGNILREEKRKSDLPGRYGGEEFIIVLPHSDSAGAKTVAERIRKKVEEHQFKDSSGCAIVPVTISIGVATYPSISVNSLTTLIKKADEALYKAKEDGRNRVEVNEDEPVTIPLI